MAGPNQALLQAKTFWNSRTQKQRIFLGAGAVGTVALIALFAGLIGAPDYKPLMSGLETADAQAVTAALAAKKIPYQLSPDGKSISVPADQVDAARLEVASNQSTHSGRLGFEIFDKVSWGQTEFDEKVNYQRALEGELERTIATLDGVKSARVHLVMATASVFLDRDRSAKASVTLKLGRGGLSREQTVAIQRLVSGAVDGLAPNDVSIIDADSNQALNHAGGSGTGDEVEQQLTRRLMETLTPIVGADHLRTSVNVEYEPGTTDISEEKYDPSVSATLSIQRSEENAPAGTAAGGVPGTSSNVPAAAKPNVPVPSMIEPGQTSKTESGVYGVNKITRRSLEPAGRIRRITAALLVDDLVKREKGKDGKWVTTTSKRSAQDLKQIELLAQTAIGIDSSRGDLVTVQNMAFDQPDAADAPTNSAREWARKNLSDFSGVIRYAMLILLFVLAYFLMIRPVQKQALALGAPKPVDKHDGELPAPDAVLPLAVPPPDDGVRVLALKEQLQQMVKAEPAGSARVVQAWLRGEAQ